MKKVLFIPRQKVEEKFLTGDINEFLNVHVHRDLLLVNITTCLMRLMRELGYEVIIRSPQDMDFDKLPHNDFNSFEYIFLETNYPEFFNYRFLNFNFRKHLEEAEDKILSYCTDPDQFYKSLKFKDISYLDRRLHSNFWRPNFKDDNDIMKWAEFNKAVISRRFLIPTFFPHEDLMQDGIFTVGFSYFYEKLYNVPFENKKRDIITIISCPFRTMQKMKLKHYGLKESDVKRFGPYFRVKAEKDRPVLSENEVQEAYANHLFAFSPAPKHEAYTWHRTRYLYCAMHKSIMLGTDPEIQFYGGPYILDKSVFEKPLSELKEIGEAQSYHFFKNLMPKDQIIDHLKQALNS